jgi:hypothetical protein
VTPVHKRLLCPKQVLHWLLAAVLCARTGSTHSGIPDKVRGPETFTWYVSSVLVVGLCIATTSPINQC